MYVLDTDTLNLIYTGQARAVARRATVPSSEIAIAVVTRIELLKGRFDFLLKAADTAQLLRAQELLTRTDELLATIPRILLIDAAVTAEFDRLRGVKGLRQIGRGDILI